MIFQLKQFFKPFPEANSWAFHFQIWMWNMFNPYSWKFKPVEYGPIFFTGPDLIAEKKEKSYAILQDTNTIFVETLDIPTYLRNGDDIPDGLNGDIPIFFSGMDPWDEYRRDSRNWEYRPDLYGGTSHNPAERSDRRSQPRTGGTS